MGNFLNKKGSFAVFAIMIFTSSIAALWIIINAAGNLAIGSTINSFGNLWGKSILGEYDLFIRDRYGLLAYYGDKASIEEKLKKYADYSLKDKEYINLQNIGCSLEDYSLADTDNLAEQIGLIALEGTKPIVRITDESSKESDLDIKESENKTITASWIIESLPSYGKADSLYITGLANSIKEGVNIESMVNNAAIDKYIFNFFKDYMNERDLGKTYFNCEVEYIICGEFSDYGLKEKTEDKIVVLRNILNLYYLYACTEKRDGVMALAASLTPGAMSFITQAVLLEAWAFAEAKNDIKLLNNNYAVALLKNDSNWALTIENVFYTQKASDTQSEEKITAEDIIKEESPGYIVPKDTDGAVYSDYLRVLLCGVPEKTKLLRIMDLIQINMKYIYCDYFLVKDYYSGLSYSLKVNNIEYEFEDEYFKKEQKG